MLDALDPEFSPLLPVGLHFMSLAGLRDLCVGRFPLSLTRGPIMIGLEAVVGRLVSVNIIGDLWVNGSFLTEKIDPEDVDLTLRMPAQFFDRCTVPQRETIDWFNTGEGLRQTYHCHGFAWVDYPEGHPLYWDSEWSRAYWMRQWGFSRGNVRKGIAVIELR